MKLEKGESLGDLFRIVEQDTRKRVAKKLNEFVGRRVSFIGVMWVDKPHPLRNKWTRFEVKVKSLKPSTGCGIIPYQLTLKSDSGQYYTLSEDCEILILD